MLFGATFTLRKLSPVARPEPVSNVTPALSVAAPPELLVSSTPLLSKKRRWVFAGALASLSISIKSFPSAGVSTRKISISRRFLTCISVPPLTLLS